MRLTLVLLAMMVLVACLLPSHVEAGKRKKIKKLLGAAGLALLLKKPKILPLPIPIPLPILVKHHAEPVLLHRPEPVAVHEPILHAEPWAEGNWGGHWGGY